MALLGGFVMVAASVTAVSRPAAADSYVEGVLYGGGCGDPLEAMVISGQGTQLANRTLVRGKKGVALEPHATSPDNKRFIFSSYNCATETHALYTQPVTTRPTARQILTLPAGWWLLDATWDVARSAPAVLYRDPDFNYYLQVLVAGTWTTLWTGSDTSIGGFYLSGIEGQTGREYLIFGDNFSRWQIWRLSAAGRIIPELNGPGDISSVQSNKYGSVNAIVGRDGGWVCDWNAWGPIGDALTQGKCVTIPGGAGYGSIFTEAAEDSTYWLHVSPSFGSNFMVKVTCVGATFLSCGTPLVRDRRTSPLGSTSSSMSNVEFPNVRYVSRLGASTIR